MKFFSYRWLNIYAVLLAIFLLVISGYLQLGLNLPPCPLCVMQRLVVAFLGILFFAGIFHIPLPRGRKIYNGFIFLVCLLGLAISLRHVYLQHLPSGSVPSCGPGLNFLFTNLPLTEAIKMMLLGSGECGEVHWRFLNLSIPEWTAIFFAIFAIIAIIQMIRRRVV